MFTAIDPALRVFVHLNENRALVRMQGDLPACETNTLKRELNRVAATQPALVVFDFSELNTLSSRAIGALVAFRRTLVRWGGKVCIVGAGLLAAAALHRSGVERLFRTDVK